MLPKRNKSHAILLPLSLILLQTLVISCTNKQRASKSGSIEDSALQTSKNVAAINTSNGTVKFVTASKMVKPTVVHIRIHLNGSSDYGAPRSGVVISSNGFIATNNHVVENASAINVILPDRRTLPAKLIGCDPNTDFSAYRSRG